jgi:hypothetical protein
MRVKGLEYVIFNAHNNRQLTIIETHNRTYKNFLQTRL